MPAFKRTRTISLADVSALLQGKPKRKRMGSRTNEAKRTNISTNSILQNPKFYNNMFPARQTRTLTYGTVVSLNVGASLGVSHVFSANGLFDPDITAAGSQPLGFDQMSELYNHYTVTSARIKCTMVHLGSAGGTPSLCGIVVSAGPGFTSADTSKEFLEHPQRSNYKLSGSVTGDPATNQMNLGVDIAKFFGKTKSSLISDDLYRGDISSNPTEQCYFQVMCNSIASTDAGIVSFIITIEYDAVFTEPKTLGSS